MSIEDQSSDLDEAALLADLDSEQFLDADETEQVKPSDTPAPASAPESALASERVDGRDDKGRFVAKAADADSIGTPAKAETPELQADVPAATAQAATTAAETPPTPAPDPDVGPTEPLKWRSGNKDWEFPGAVVTTQGIFITPDRADLLKTALGKATTLDETRETLKRERYEIRQKQELFAAETQPVLAEITNFFEMAKSLRSAQTVEAQQAIFEKMAGWALDFADKEPLLRERAALEKEKREIALQRELQQPDPETQAQQTTQAMLAYVDEEITAAKQYPEFKDLTDQDYAVLKKWVAEDPQAFLTRGADGQPAFAGDRFANLVRREAQRVGQLNQQKAENAKALEAAKKLAADNAKRLNGGKPVVPTATVAHKPTAKPDQPARRQTRDEFEREIEDGLKAALA